MEDSDASVRDLNLLKEIERDPDTTQANLAARLGVAVGTVNWHLKRLINKGYIKVKRAERRKLRYIITPEGIALRAKLTVAYIENSMQLYRKTRRQARMLMQTVRKKGYQGVKIEGDGDIADICRLTGIEQGITLVETRDDANIAVIEIEGQELRLREPQEE